MSDAEVHWRRSSRWASRAAKLTSLSGLGPVLTDALTMMATRSAQPAEIGEAAAEVRALHVTMDENSELHTPNLM